MLSDVDFVKAAVEGGNPPPKDRTRLDETGTIEGIPAFQFQEQERAIQAQGGTTLTNDDGTPYDRNDPDKGEKGEINDKKLFVPRVDTQLFKPKERVQTGLASAAAADQAYSDGFISQNPDGFQEGKAAYEAGATVMDEAVAMTRRKLVEQNFANLGFLDPEYFDNLSPVEQIEEAQRQIKRLDMRTASIRDIALTQAFLSGAGEARIPEFEKWSKTVSVPALMARVDNYTREQRSKIRPEVDAVVAAQGWKNMWHAVAEIGMQDMTIFFPLASRLGILEGIEESAGIESKGGWFLGTRRQNIRNKLYEMNSEEFLAAGVAIRAQIEEWRKDPVKNVFVTRYALLEQLERIFTEDVFNGKSAKDAGDVWIGNAETLLESLFSVVVVTKAGKSLWGLWHATDAVTAKGVARAAGKPHVAARIEEELQMDNVALPFGLEADEAVPAMLPRPARFAGSTENLPDGTKDVLIRNESTRTEIIESSDHLTGQGLTPANKTNIVNETIKTLDLIDGAHVQGRMNVLQMKENGTGFNMRVVVGESAEGGYKNIEDAVQEALLRDPHLEKMRIMRVNQDGVLEPVFMDADTFARAATKGEVDPATAGRIAGGDTVDESFYLTYDVDQFWHSIDKEAFGGNTFLNGGLAPRALMSPNGKFSDEIYGNFARAHMDEQVILKNFEVMFQPFYKLGLEDKKFVTAMSEWAEEFGKNHGRAPAWDDVISKYDGITEKQLNGFASLRDGLDTMHELFNRRLYRDWKAEGFKTARPANTAQATFHGKVLERTDAGRGGAVLDPETGKMIQVSSKELDDIYNAGGRVMKLDAPIDAANDVRSMATRVLVREGTYKVGELSTKPLKYHPGYSIRFYDDPYYVVKVTDGVAIDGALRTGKASTVEDALATAGTFGEADRRVKRLAEIGAERGEVGVTYKVTRANDITKTESNLFQKQTLHREGRLFWDNRNFERLPDVNGNRAKLEDPIKSLERGIGIAARQLTHEDLLKGVKNAWKNDYGKLLPEDMLQKFDLKKISDDLRDLARNTPDKGARKHIMEGRELIDYMRLVEGTEQQIVPWMRSASLSAAVTINKFTGAKWTGLEKFAMGVDPFRAMRSVAFKLFMVARPVRQALLQGSQIGYLAALDPLYVASPKFFGDALALRRGVTKTRLAGYTDGFSDKHFAKMMGMSSKEYRLLIKEFDRSGIIDLVDVHSFAGGTRGFRKARLPANDSISGTIGYRMRQGGRATEDFLKTWGFNLGEGNNLVFTYNLARKRLMDRKGYKSVLELSRKDWNDLRTEASNMALGMIKPNNFGYQTGALGVATQFFSFGHKAALGLLGSNPALKGRDAIKILFGTYLLYGANMFGSRDLVEEQLTKIGVPDQNVPGTNISLVDFISGGLVDSTFNMVGNLTVDEWQDVALDPFAPGLDFNRVWEQTLENILHQPAKAVLGPFGNIASKVLTSLNFAYRVAVGSPDLPAGDKFALTSQAILSGTLPVYNDVMQSYIGYQMNQWYSTAGEPLPLEPTMNGLIARGLIGVRTREELGWYRLQNRIWEDKQQYNNIRDANQKFLRLQATLLGEGTASEAEVHRNISAMVNIFEEWPEAIRSAMLKDSMGEISRNDSLTPSVYSTLIDVLKDQRLSPEIIDEMIDRFPSIPTEKREQLRDLAQSAYKSRVYVESQELEELKKEHTNGNTRPR